MSLETDQKVCKICNIEKSIYYFDVCLKKGNKIYHRAICKKCFYTKNKDYMVQYAKKYYKSNRDSILDRTSTYHKEHSEEQNERVKKYNKNNRVKINYRLKNRGLLDPSYNLRHNISRAIRTALFASGSSKNNHSCFNYLGYSFVELKEHLKHQFEPWMSWANYGKYNSKIWNDNDPLTWTWNIDHIIPQSKLPYKSMDDENFKKCWSLNNLRPLSSKQNCLDGTKRIRHNNVI